MAAEHVTFLYGRRAHHACRPPKSTKGRGDRFICSCGRIFEIYNGMKWEPAIDDLVQR